MAVKVMEQLIDEERGFAIYNGDCIDVMKGLPDASVHFSIYSPPFGGLYQYSSSDRDLSNARDLDEFLDHYGIVVREKHRITMPGRLSAVHCADIPKSNTGKADNLIDLPGKIVALHEKHGWGLAARHFVWKEPLGVRNRTMTKALAHKTVIDDASHAGVASADQLLVFRRSGENKVPIANPTGYSYWPGEEQIPKELLSYVGFDGDQKTNKLSHWIWRHLASASWMDVRLDRVLPYEEARDEDDERHIHPLQLDVIERAIMLRSNAGEIVFTPFMGVGSEVVGALSLGRKAIGAELKSSYYRQAVKNTLAAKPIDFPSAQPMLFE